MDENQWPLAKEGFPFLIPSLLLALAMVVLGWTLQFAIFALLSLFIAFFFRNPKRDVPDLENVILAPADGRIVHVGEAQEGRFLKSPALKISIFMSIFDVHINRSPVNARLVEKSYHPGRFRIASAEKASLDNEQNALLLETEEGLRIVLVQIAGLIARRIVCYTKPGDRLRRGEIFGLIRFGSRVDLYLPLGVKPTVRLGQHVRGGESIVGYRV